MGGTIAPVACTPTLPPTVVPGPTGAGAAPDTTGGGPAPVPGEPPPSADITAALANLQAAVNQLSAAVQAMQGSTQLMGGGSSPSGCGCGCCAPPAGPPASPSPAIAAVAPGDGAAGAPPPEARGAAAAPPLPPPPPADAPAGPSRLSGDLDGLDPKLRERLEQVARRLDRDLNVESGHRTRGEQEELYRRYRAGTGNLAAVPGTSRHESGRAADVYVGDVALAKAPGGREAAAAAGLGFPVAGEAWHVEPVD